MKIVDANAVLRYLLADGPTLFAQSEQILENEAVYFPFEVLAEVVYVLDKVYAVPRPAISASLAELLRYPRVSTYDAEVALRALETYCSSSLHIVGSLLCGSRSLKGTGVVTFDKQLNRHRRTV